MLLSFFVPMKTMALRCTNFLMAILFIFTASDAYGIDSTDITNWDNSYDGKVSLDTSAQSGTTDGDLYAAIVALGWASDVIE